MFVCQRSIKKISTGVRGSIVLLLIAATSVSANQKDSDTPFKQDSALLKSALEQAHPSYGRYASDAEIAGLWAGFDASTQNPSLSPLQYYAAVSKLLAGLKCDHTKAELPKGLADDKKAHMLPFTFRIFQNKMLIDGSVEDALQRGDEITHINDVPVLQILSMLHPYISIDGYTDHVINSKIEHDSDLIGSDFEQFFAPVVLGLDDYPEEYSISYRAKGQSPATINVGSIDFTTWRKMSSQPYRLDFKDAVELTYIDSNVALLAVDTFVNFRNPVDANALFSKLFKELNARGIRKLIVDLRLNGGGSHDAQLALMQHLYQQPFQLVSGGWLNPTSIEPIKPQLQSWDRSFIDVDKSTLMLESKGAKLPIEAMGINAQRHSPAPDAFTGELLMLSSRQNASASAALLSHAATQNNVTVIGEFSGGNQGGTSGTNMAFLPLPRSGVTVRIPMVRNQYNIEGAADGLGVSPDVYVTQSLSDWLQKKDTILEAAVAMAVSDASD